MERVVHRFVVRWYDTCSMKQGLRATRVEWVDFARACAIILAIVGHCVGHDDGGSFLRGAIFSFHMPMFFFLSAVTMKCSAGREGMVKRIKKDVKRLLLPFLLIWAGTVIVDLIVGYFTFAQWKEKLLSLVFSSGTPVEFAGMEIPQLGMAWFLVSLFTVRTVFDYLHSRLSESMVFVVSMICGILGVVIGTQQYLAFSLDVSLAVMPFFYFGYRYGHRQQEEGAGEKELITTETGASGTGTAGDCAARANGTAAGRYPAALQLIWPAIWIVTLFLTFPDVKQWSYLELSIRRYSLFPVSYICAFAGILMMIAFSRLCCRTRYLKRPILAVGKNCLYLYMIHMVDPYWHQLYEIEGRQFITALARVGIDLAILIAVVAVIKGIRLLRAKKMASK